MADLSELALVAQAKMFHNQKAFGRLVEKYQSAVRRFFLHQTLGDAQLSDDLAQDTFVKAYVNLGSFRGQSAFSTWLFRIAYNVHYDYVRRNRPEQTSLDDAQVASRHSANHDSALQMDLYEALHQLSPPERSCITLQLIDGYPIDKISEITGMPMGTVKSHLKRGKTKLANYLKENGYDGK